MLLNKIFKKISIFVSVFIILGIGFMLAINSLGDGVGQDNGISKQTDVKKDRPIIISRDQIIKIANSPALTSVDDSLPEVDYLWHMKLINETVTDNELDELQNLGINILGGEWGMNDISPEQFLNLLDRVDRRDMKFIANFSDGAAWGYSEEVLDLETLEPEWQSEKIGIYLQKIKDHPAIYGYDIANEAGENLPNGDLFRISLKQIRDAAQDVRSTDNRKPIIIRMHYWDEEDGDFTDKSPFAPDIADIVILNLYSNYSIDRKNALLPNMIKDSAQELVDKILQIDPGVDIWISLAAFKEDPFFIAPRVEDIKRDIESAQKINNIKSIGFFGWGPERYPTEGDGWYLPRDGKDLLEIINKYTELLIN